MPFYQDISLTMNTPANSKGISKIPLEFLKVLKIAGGRKSHAEEEGIEDCVRAAARPPQVNYQTFLCWFYYQLFLSDLGERQNIISHIRSPLFVCVSTTVSVGKRH